MSHIWLTCGIHSKYIEDLNEVSASDVAVQLQKEAKKREMLKNGHYLLKMQAAEREDVTSAYPSSIGEIICH